MSKVSTEVVENRAPQKNHKPWIWVIVGILVAIIGVIGYFVISDKQQEDLLKSEMNELFSKDFDDDFTVSIKTKGDYAVVERVIKTYFKEISDAVKVANQLEEDEEFLNILTPDNFKEDGPKFEKSMAKITEIRKDMSEAIQKLSDLCQEEYILSIIEKQKLDSYYVDLYKDLMYSDDDLKDIQEARDEMVEVGVKFNVFLDDCEEIIKFLKNNSGDWVIENGSIIFRTDALLEKYNTLTEKLVKDSEF